MDTRALTPVSTRTAPPDEPGAALVVTGDELLLHELLPLTAAADVTPQVVDRAEQALVGWSRARVVLVGLDRAGELAALGPDYREHVYLVATAHVPDDAFRTALALGARQVVELPVSAGWLVDLLTDLTEQGADRGQVVGVIGGSGGAGATTLACAMGQWAARRTTAALVDCDPQGPGLDRMLGMERCEGFRWDALCRTTGRLSARALRDALPRRDGLGVLSWYVGAEQQTLQAFAVREALSAARRGHGAVVVDLPRSGDRLVAEIAARCDRLVVVTQASLVGVAGAARMRGRFADHPAVGLALRGNDLEGGDVARAVGAPVWTQMRDQRGLDEAVDLGLGPLRSLRGPLARAAQDLWDGGPA
ncbi:septum site-determining protein Ssd [Nocardioides sambongensis]|uniref:septum site-determining protein Ssd n=1 Tax=Nocardioides sambongensis TaxID=2589074 RepID=UPI0011275DCA|nr:septum site-determining protein Ssd [Nocardioides sambongensis]